MARALCEQRALEETHQSDSWLMAAAVLDPKPQLVLGTIAGQQGSPKKKKKKREL